MQQLFYLSLYVLVGSILLCVLEPFTRYCRRRSEEFEQQRAGRPKPVEVQPDVPAAFSDHDRGGLWLGFIFAPLAVIFFYLNARILAEVFSRLTDEPPTEIFRIVAYGFPFIVTDQLLKGFSFTIAEVVVGGAAAWAKETHRKGLFWLMVVPVVALGLYEVGVTAYDKYLIAIAEKLPISPLVNGLFGTLQAIVSLGMSLISGYFVIHRTIVPLLTTIGAAMARLFKSGQSAVGNFSPFAILFKIIAIVDEGIFERLRALDRAMLGFLRRIFTRKGVAHV